MSTEKRAFSVTRAS